MPFDVPYVTPPYCVQSADHVIDNIRAELWSLSETHSSYHLFICTLFRVRPHLYLPFYGIQGLGRLRYLFFYFFSPYSIEERESRII